MSCSVSLTFRKAFGGSMQCGNSTWHFLDRMTRWPAGKGLQLRAEEALVLERGPRSPEPLEFLVASPAFHQGTTPPGHLAAYDVAIREVVLVRRLDELDGLWHPPSSQQPLHGDGAHLERKVHARVAADRIRLVDERQ